MPPETKSQTIVSPPQATSKQSQTVTAPQNSKRKIYITLTIVTVFTLFSTGGWAYYQNTPEGIRRTLTKNILALQSYEGTIEIGSNEAADTLHGPLSVDAANDTSYMKLEDGKGLMQTEMVTQGKVAYTKTTLKDQKMKEMLHFPLEWIKIDESTASTSFPVPKTDSITTVQKIDTTWTLPIKQTINGKEFYVTSLTVNTASTGTSTIEWRFSSATKTVDSMKITNDGAYFLVHIGKINSSPAIDIPKNTLTLKEWDAKRFLLGLSKDKIKDITIYRVNGVTDEEVAVVKKAIQQYYGIEATVWQSVIPSSLKNGWWYNPKTKQFDGDALWNSIASWFLTSATTTRGILLVPDDMYTNITPSPYIFSRSLPKVSTVVISVARLRENGTSSPEMKKQLLEDRLTKITVRTLGVSVGLAYSEDGDKKECIFYQATTTEELDTVGKDVCPIAKVGIPMLFEKKP